MRLFPPGPLLPTWPEPPGCVDLGVRLRDQCFTSGFFAGTAREALRARFAESLEANRLEDAALQLEAWLDCWPLAAMVDPAREQWQRSPDGRSLAVLAKAAGVICRATGWVALEGGPWPLPDADWLAAAAVGCTFVQSRGGSDGSAEVAAALSLPVEQGSAPDLAPVAELNGEQLAGRREELGRALACGLLAAVRFTSPVPGDAPSQLALGEVRLEGRSQLGFERHGLAGLLVGAVPTWDELLDGAPPGIAGETLRPCCEAMILPGTPTRIRRGQLDDTGWLVWSDAVRPLAVHPVAVHALRGLDGRRDLAAVAASLGAPPDQLADVLHQLVEVGAATAT